jgi:hypothetical protein
LPYLQLRSLWIPANKIDSLTVVFIKEVLLCPEEMEQALPAKDQEQAEAWVVAWGRVGEGWGAIVLEQVPAGTVYVPVVGREFLIKLVSLVIT